MILDRIGAVSGLLLIVVALSACSNWANNWMDDAPEVLVKEAPHKFKGKVIVIGAGAAGLAAAKLLQLNGVEFVVLEATDHFGGRVQKNDSFADFPIDTGAEWIHHDKHILTRLTGESHIPIELIRYAPTEVYEWSNGIYAKMSAAMLKALHWSVVEYKFKRSTWFDFIDTYFHQPVKQHIVYNAPVVSVNYQGENVVVTTANGEVYSADKVISTVSVGVLKSQSIQFQPALPQDKREALNTVDFPPGFKLFLKFSDKFYADVIEASAVDQSGSSTGEKTYYDLAYHKGAADHVLGLLSTGTSAEAYYQLNSEQAIVEAVLAELDLIYDGKASASYTGEYLLKDWGHQAFTLGTWTNALDADKEYALNRPLSERLYFAGETHNIYNQTSTVHGAIESGYSAVYDLLEPYQQ